MGLQFQGIFLILLNWETFDSGRDILHTFFLGVWVAKFENLNKSEKQYKHSMFTNGFDDVNLLLHAQ